jgi:hypothetical protein
MTNWSKARSKAAILFILVAMVVSGCAGGQTSQQTGQQTVSMQYMLTESGFQPWGVNLETPKRQALLESMPTGKIVTYRRDGEVYHVYADERFNTLYIGDEASGGWSGRRFKPGRFFGPGSAGGITAFFKPFAGYEQISLADLKLAHGGTRLKRRYFQIKVGRRALQPGRP